MPVIVPMARAHGADICQFNGFVAPLTSEGIAFTPNNAMNDNCETWIARLRLPKGDRAIIRELAWQRRQTMSVVLGAIIHNYVTASSSDDQTRAS
jgi:hypothetical protein